MSERLWKKIDFGLKDFSAWPAQSPVFKGGALTPSWLLSAYCQGLYPLYFESGTDVYWWSPDPRMVLMLENFHVSRRFKRSLQKNSFSFSLNMHSRCVIELCATTPRPCQNQTWIYPEMIEAYSLLADKGFVYTVAVWQGESLVGGLYGVVMGKIFFGESMFSLVSGASRSGFAYLVDFLQSEGFWLIDCQQESAYLRSMGAESIPRTQFYEWIEENRKYL